MSLFPPKTFRSDSLNLKKSQSLVKKIMLIIYCSLFLIEMDLLHKKANQVPKQ